MGGTWTLVAEVVHDLGRVTVRDPGLFVGQITRPLLSGELARRLRACLAERLRHRRGVDRHGLPAVGVATAEADAWPAGYGDRHLRGGS